MTKEFPFLVGVKLAIPWKERGMLGKHLSPLYFEKNHWRIELMKKVEYII